MLIQDAGFEATQRILRISREPADAKMAKALSLNEGDDVVKIERVRYGNGTPLILERNVFPLAYGEQFLTMTSDSPSIHRQLEESGTKIDNVARILRVRMTTEAETELLELEQPEPVWHEELRASTFQGAPVEYGENIVLGTVANLRMSNVRGSSIPLKFRLDEYTE